MQKEVYTKIPKRVVLSADVGGTNTNIGLCSVKGRKVALHAKYVFESQKLAKFEDAVKQVLSDSKVKVFSACIAAAGPVSQDRKSCQLTNIKWKIETKKLPFKAKLLNDFEALGYAINVLGSRDIKVIRKGSSKGIVALIGAGTGLGKAVLSDGKIIVPLASEGGHSDLPIMPEEIELLKFLSKKGVAEYEDALSGRGLIALFDFYLKSLGGSGTRLPAEVVKEDSPAAEAARKQFVKFYARCAKNFALDVLARGGVIIGGGIAAKNPGLFGKEFVKEFMRNSSQKEVLAKLPLRIITNIDAGLLGAALYARL